MKQFRQFAALLLSLVLILGMSISAFAAGTGTKYIEIGNSTDGYVYSAYEIFDGEDDGNGKLSNITWGNGIKSSDFITALQAEDSFKATSGAINPFVTATTAALVADVISGWSDDSEKIQKFAELAFENKDTAAATSTDKGDYYQLEVTEGYFLVYDTTIPTTDATHTRYLLKVSYDNNSANPVKVAPKSTEVPEVTKEAKDPTYATGDLVDYTITAKLPASYADYDKYQLKITDTLSSGLELITTSVVVSYGGTTLTASSDYTMIASANSLVIDLGANDGSIYDVKQMTSVTPAALGVFTVTYQAKLTAEAITSVEGVTNSAILTFSNDPNNGGEGTTNGIPVEENVYTLQLLINKVDEEGVSLTGAEFTLYNADGTSVVGALEVDSTDGSKHTITGLKAGKYVLKETTTPTGYNTIEDITFTLSVTEDGELKAITSTGLTLSDTDLEIGQAVATIQNKSGNTLPETGGMGTKLFITCGGFAAMMAAIFLVTNKRMSKEEF